MTMNDNTGETSTAMCAVVIGVAWMVAMKEKII